MAFSSRLPALEIPPGYGFASVHRSLWSDLQNLYGKLLIWEPPLSTELYVLSADIGDGLGLDRSVCDITRVGTLARPEEQVAQFVSAEVDPIDFAAILDVIGRLYRGSDNQEALAAIECNNHGLATQSELQRHLGYDNLFIWQYEDAADPQRRFSTRVGWYTTQRTRPIILTRYIKKVKSVDPNTGRADYQINSPFTLEELRDFQVPPGGAAWQAEADPTAEDAHDDCIMSGAIGVHVAQTLQFEGGETLADTRKRKEEERARQSREEERLKRKRDWINTDASTDEMRAGDLSEDEDYG